MSNEKQILVFGDWVSLGKPSSVGTLSVSKTRGEEIFSFEYDQNWLDRADPQVLDPSLDLFEGRQYPAANKANFGIFLDSCPDRWGRMLMERKEVLQARTEKRPPRTLMESDFLLGVFDKHRMGGLRFKTPDSSDFQNSDPTHTAPPWTRLRELQNASKQVEEQNEQEDASAQFKWVKMLIAPGSSLGGARPKSSVVDADNQLWIAKFPSKNDRRDVGLWEQLVYLLALESQIVMSESRVTQFSSEYHTFTTKRFDRIGIDKRLHFASAMTLLQRDDGDDYSDGVSYIELVEFLMSNGSQTDTDLEQLWRRIVFFMCISNTDDHLRNHGFLLEQDGWKLAPAYDVNPISDSTGLKLNVSEKDNSLDLELAKEVAPLFRVEKTKMNKIIREVVAVVKTWKQKAEYLGLRRSEQDQMQSAFRVAEQYSG